MDHQTIWYSTDGAIATISLNRPERLNTIVPPMPEEIAAAVDTANLYIRQSRMGWGELFINATRCLGITVPHTLIRNQILITK